MKHVFISYVRENQDQVDRLYQDLAEAGVEVWLDKNNIDPGVFWKEAIRKAILGGDFFVACFSKEYNERVETVMNEELTLAIEVLRKRSRDRSWFLPVKLSECDIPDRNIGAGETLQDLQYIGLYPKKNWGNGIKRILQVVQPIPVGLQTHIQNLHTGLKDIRVGAAFHLGEIGDARAVLALVEALSDDSWEVRESAASALGKIGAPMAIPALTKALSDEDKDVRICAATALGEIGKPEAMEAV